MDIILFKKNGFPLKGSCFSKIGKDRTAFILFNLFKAQENAVSIHATNK